jgi:hypothetical protein
MPKTMNNKVPLKSRNVEKRRKNAENNKKQGSINK